MIKLTATALVHSVSPVMQVGQSSFQKRELILNDSWEREGELHDNFVLVEFTGDKMPMLDAIMPGQRVTVEAFVNGREYQGRYYTSLRGMSVAPYQPQPQQAPQQQYQQPAAPVAQQYPQQQTYQQPPYQQAQYPQPQAAPAYPPASYPQQQPYQQAPQPGYNAGAPTAANLPFPPQQ